jgi:protein-disulfide isomerase
MHKYIGALGALFILFGGVSAPAQSALDTVPYEELPRMGEADAPVKVVEFADFKCPHCKTFHDEVFPKLKEEFIDTGVVAFYYMHFPVISQDSVTAGAAAAAIHDMYGIDAFWTFQSTLYDNQGNPRQTWATPEFLASMAAAVIDEVNMRRLVRAIRNDAYVNVVRRDRSVGQELGVNGTPTLFVGDTMVQDYRDWEAIRSLINERRP